MNKITILLRSTSFNRGLIISNTIRGAKKKKEGPAQTVAASQDIINIFKDRKDPDILPITQYPPWLLELCLPQLPPEIVYAAWYTDNDLFKPEARDAIRLSHLIKRRKLKESNYKQALLRRPLEQDVPPIYMKNLFQQAKVREEEQEAAAEGEGEEGAEGAEGAEGKPGEKGAAAGKGKPGDKEGGKEDAGAGGAGAKGGAGGAGGGKDKAAGGATGGGKGAKAE